ncbi:MAG: 30S ribosomal protein S8 [Parcubacteria group bacterium]|nr:30S ribosomal protein S8 [Parcubacteria group bacterium]
MLHDPISDMLTRMRNAVMVRKPEVVMPYSKMKMAIANILKREGFIEDAERVEKGESTQFDILKIRLKYVEKQPAIQSLRRLSKPSLRIYRKKGDLPRVLNGYGIAIVSTSRGLMTNKEAAKSGLGGEVICEIY